MIKLRVKPLSVNEIYKGRRFRTDKYNVYIRQLMFCLPNMTIPKGKLEIEYRFGLSSKLADIDGPVKAITDILQKRYSFNDRDVFRMVINKEIVTKGNEYIEFKITPYFE